MKIAKGFLIAPIVLGFVMSLARPGAGDGAVKIGDLPTVNGYLGDYAPDGGWIETYNDKNYKFVSYTSVELGQGETIVVEVYSFDYQPVIFAQAMDYTILGNSAPLEPRLDPTTKRTVYGAHLDYRATDLGRKQYIISHAIAFMATGSTDSTTIGQGSFILTGSIWGTKQSTAPSGETSGTTGPDLGHTECDCQDPASGRFFSSGGITLGGAIDCPPPPPPDSADWCQ